MREAAIEVATEDRRRLWPSTSVDMPKGRRGPRAQKMERIARQMDAQYGTSPTTRKELEGIKEQALADEYSCSRETARKARQKVLSEFSLKTPTIDK